MDPYYLSDAPRPSAFQPSKFKYLYLEASAPCSASDGGHPGTGGHPAGPAPRFRSSRKSQSRRPCFADWRAMSAIDEVSGIPFGQASTQLPAFPQSLTPPASIRPCSRSLAFIAPVGCVLNNRTCEMAAAPMNWVAGVTCGQTSRQQPQVMQVDRTAQLLLLGGLT